MFEKFTAGAIKVITNISTIKI